MSFKVAQNSFLIFFLLILWWIDATTLFHLCPNLANGIKQMYPIIAQQVVIIFPT